MERDSFVDVAILCVCVCSFQMTNKYIICIYMCTHLVVAVEYLSSL